MAIHMAITIMGKDIMGGMGILISQKAIILKNKSIRERQKRKDKSKKI